MVSEQQDAYRVILERLDANGSVVSCKDAEIAVGTSHTDFIEEGCNVSNQEMQDELHRLQGALEALGLMRERLLSQRDEMGAENGLEAVDEMLTQVDALQLEFQHRLENLDS